MVLERLLEQIRVAGVPERLPSEGHGPDGLKAGNGRACSSHHRPGGSSHNLISAVRLR